MERNSTFNMFLHNNYKYSEEAESLQCSKVWDIHWIWMKMHVLDSTNGFKPLPLLEYQHPLMCYFTILVKRWSILPHSLTLN